MLNLLTAPAIGVNDFANVSRFKKIADREKHLQFVGRLSCLHGWKLQLRLSQTFVFSVVKWDEWVLPNSILIWWRGNIPSAKLTLFSSHKSDCPKFPWCASSWNLRVEEKSPPIWFIDQQYHILLWMHKLTYRTLSIEQSSLVGSQSLSA
jgi:hypothetical protein